MAKPLRVAGEVDGWCTRCRLILNHRIVSMKNSKAHQVECLTCRTTHLWRPNAPGEKPAAPASTDKPRAIGATSGGRPSRAPSAAAAKPRQQWEAAIAGKSVHDFTAYDVRSTFKPGELVRHKKFGDGVVTRIIDGHKVEVLFGDEARTLAQAMT